MAKKKNTEEIELQLNANVGELSKTGDAFNKLSVNAEDSMKNIGKQSSVLDGVDKTMRNLGNTVSDVDKKIGRTSMNISVEEIQGKLKKVTDEVEETISKVGVAQLNMKKGNIQKITNNALGSLDDTKKRLLKLTDDISKIDMNVSGDKVVEELDYVESEINKVKKSIGKIDLSVVKGRPDISTDKVTKNLSNVFDLIENIKHEDFKIPDIGKEIAHKIDTEKYSVTPTLEEVDKKTIETLTGTELPVKPKIDPDIEDLLQDTVNKAVYAPMISPIGPKTVDLEPASEPVDTDAYEKLNKLEDNFFKTDKKIDKLYVKKQKVTKKIFDTFVKQLKNVKEQLKKGNITKKGYDEQFKALEDQSEIYDKIADKGLANIINKVNEYQKTVEGVDIDLLPKSQADDLKKAVDYVDEIDKKFQETGRVSGRVGKKLSEVEVTINRSSKSFEAINEKTKQLKKLLSNIDPKFLSKEESEKFDEIKTSSSDILKKLFSGKKLTQDEVDSLDAKIKSLEEISNLQGSFNEKLDIAKKTSKEIKPSYVSDEEKGKLKEINNFFDDISAKIRKNENLTQDEISSLDGYIEQLDIMKDSYTKIFEEVEDGYRDVKTLGKKLDLSIVPEGEGKEIEELFDKVRKKKLQISRMKESKTWDVEDLKKASDLLQEDIGTLMAIAAPAEKIASSFSQSKKDITMIEKRAQSLKEAGVIEEKLMSEIVGEAEEIKKRMLEQVGAGKLNVQAAAENERQLQRITESLDKEVKTSEELTRSYDEANDVSSETLTTMKQMEASGEITAGKAKKLRKEVEKINNKMKDQKKNGKMTLKQVNDYNKGLKNILGGLKKETTIENQSLTARQAEAKLAWEQAKIEMDRLKAEDGSLMSLGKRFQIMKKNIPNAAIAKFGKGVQVAGAAAKGLGGGIMKLATSIPGLGFALGAGAFAYAMLEADKRIKGMRKDIQALAADSGKWGQMGTDATEEIRQKAKKLGAALSVPTEEILQWESGFVKAGYKLNEVSSGLEKASATSMALGMDMGELAGTMGTIREELGGTFDDTNKSLMDLTGVAKESGITMTRFYSKVVNAASGLGIYGTKIVDVGNMFGGLVKQMKLPEKEATEVADKMIKGFAEMDQPTRMLIAQQSQFGKDFDGIMTNITKDLGDANGDVTKMNQDHVADMIKLMGLEETYLDKDGKLKEEHAQEALKLAKGYAAMAQGPARTVEAMLAADPMKIFQERFSQLMGNMKFSGVNVNGEMDVKQADSMLAQLKGQRLEMGALGELYGMSGDDMFAAITKMVEGQTEGRKEGEKFRIDFSKVTKGVAEENAKKDALNVAKQNRALRAANRPVLDALEQTIANLLDDIYTFIVGTIAPFFLDMISYTKQGFGKLIEVFPWISEDMKKQGQAWQLEAILDRNKRGNEIAGKMLIKNEKAAKENQEKIDGLKEELGNYSKDSKEYKDTQDQIAGLVKKQTEMQAKGAEYAEDQVLTGKKLAVAQEKQGKLVFGQSGNLKENAKNLTDMKNTLDAIDAGGADTNQELIKQLTKVSANTGGDSNLQQLGFKTAAEVKTARETETKKLAVKTEPEPPKKLTVTNVPVIDIPEVKQKKAPSKLDGEHSPVELKLMEPAKVLEPQFKGFDFSGDNLLDAMGGMQPVVPETEPAMAGTASTTNDNRVVNIYVNHKEAEYIKQVVYNALYESEMTKK